ncbi:Ras-related protein RAB1BV [Orchesella cincta]|uniref:Ras-related protein RAB1BV n=1 Tax=Orchesella cincta TaxID=48709 RepID=A0A1D2MHL0_ORCCI|nr:Ras-related protein RAB1BV [Orchesella cincta]
MSSETFKCSICLEFNSEADGKDWFVSTPGGHVFHYTCIKRIIDRGHRSCPMCREALSLSNLTRLYGIDPSVKLSKKARHENSNCNSENSLSMRKPDYTFKLVLLGNSAVGKSCLLKRFSTGVFHCDMTATTGCDMCFKTIEMGEKIVKLNIWDTVGQEKFRSIAHNFVRNAQGVLLVYDVTQAATFEAIPDWIDFVDKAGPQGAVKVLIGNKIDEPEGSRTVTTDQGRALASSLGLSFFETSAKECNNVEAAFRCLVGEIMEYIIMNTSDFDSEPDDTISSSSCRLQLPRTSSSYDDFYYGNEQPEHEQCLC